MSTVATHASIWPQLRAAFEYVADRSHQQPIVVSSLPQPPGQHPHGTFPLALVPEGRMIAFAVGLRAARPDQPLILVGAADSVTLGTNHLIHAARRNIGMTLVLLRADVLAAPGSRPLSRAEWSTHASTGPAGKPLEWATALQANLVARSTIADPRLLGEIVLEATRTPGFSVVGVTEDPTLTPGVMSRATWPEYFTAYRQWNVGAPAAPSAAPPATYPTTSVPAPSRLEVRIAGFGGQGIKLAGTVLAHAAGIEQGLWATQLGVYGAATRGGRSRVDVVLGREPITYPAADHADLLVLLDGGAVEAYGTTAARTGQVVVDDSLATGAPRGAVTVPIVQLAREYAGTPLAAGVTSLGCVAALLECLPLEAICAAVRTELPAGAVDRNLAALRRAHDRTSRLAER